MIDEGKLERHEETGFVQVKDDSERLTYEMARQRAKQVAEMRGTIDYLRMAVIELKVDLRELKLEVAELREKTSV